MSAFRRPEAYEYGEVSLSPICSASGFVLRAGNRRIICSAYSKPAKDIIRRVLAAQNGA